ncbi:C40 family peptidase [Cellulomonas hominis]
MRFELAGHGRTGRAVAVVIAAALIGLPGSTALANPSDPTDQEVAAARGAVSSAQGAVADIEVRLAQQSAERDQAHIAVQQAGEAYARAQSDLETATAQAAAADARAATAATELEAARSTLVSIARQTARSGGSMDTLQAVLSADGFDEVVERTSSMSHLSSKADQAVQQYKAAQQVATTLQGLSDTAAQHQQAAAQAAQDSLAAAQQVATETESSLAAAQTERTALIAQLAAARNTSAEVESARQDQLDADRAARANAAAQAERLPAAPTNPATPGGTPASTTPQTPSTPSTPSTPATPAPPAAGGGTTPPPAAPPVVPDPPAPPTSSPGGGLGSGTSRGSADQGAAAVAWATAQVGLPYQWGGTGPSGYDCSGLTQKAWKNAGVNLNRTSRDQYKQVLKISYSDLRPGDLVFWSTDSGNADAIYHVAIWIGNGQIMEASSESRPLRIAPMRWANTMPYAGRP